MARKGNTTLQLTGQLKRYTIHCFQRSRTCIQVAT